LIFKKYIFLLYFIFLYKKIADVNGAMRHGISHGVGFVVGLFRSTNPIKKNNLQGPTPPNY
jgi:hypothetical protein